MKNPHLDTNPDGHQGGRKLVEGACTHATDSRKKGSHGHGFPVVLQSLPLLPSSSSPEQVGTLLKFAAQWRGITSSRLNMVKGHHL